MLKIAEKSDFSVLSDFLSDGIISLRILSYFIAYGTERDFVKFFIHYDESGIQGVISFFEDSVLVEASDRADFSEISSFLSMNSFSVLSCRNVIADLLGFDCFETKQGYIYRGNDDEFSADNLHEESLKAVYNLISESIPGSFENTKEAYLSFLSDYLFRERRNLARGKCIREDDGIIACAITSAETDSKALLSGVAASNNCKGKGYGRKVVISLVNDLLRNGKTPYVIALNDSAKGFYEHIGFKKDSLIAYVNRKDN